MASMWVTTFWNFVDRVKEADKKSDKSEFEESGKFVENARGVFRLSLSANFAICS